MQNLSIRAPLLIVASFSSMVIASQSHRRRRSNRREHGNHQCCTPAQPHRLSFRRRGSKQAPRAHRLLTCAGASARNMSDTHKATALEPGCGRVRPARARQRRNVGTSMKLGAGLLIGAGLDGGPGWQGAGTQRHGRGPVLWCDTADVLGIPDLRLGRGRVKHRVHVRSCPARGEFGWVGSRGMTVGAREHSVKLKGSCTWREFASGKGAFPTRSDIVPLLRPQMNQGYKPTHSFFPKVGGGIAL